MSQIFGYKNISEFQALGFFKESKNVFVKYYYQDYHTKRLTESKLFRLEKPDLLVKKDIDINQALKQIKIEKIVHKRNITDKDFQDSINKILVRNIFPNQIMQTFYYTDNRTKLPTEPIKTSQLSMDF
ncbi:hypothetical protein CRV02_08315 [Arcobacter sp. CECT 8989]|uniref:hypothetical protein n=1 Tax=Arcobacter sp. CECT 8989 TaxID=2044509 RepID=UPI00100B0536|nr:hypothetical protein [Arcobacter sp. CECT 8989]RXK01503.1 hypothetical protein CRV02_08315 [Arcobacter sp. CECT 8989]